MFTLPVTGTYTILVDPRDQQLGTLTFTLNAVPDNTGTTTIGTPTTVTIGTIGESRGAQLHGDGRAEGHADGDGQHDSRRWTSSCAQPNGGPVASLFVSGPTAFRDTFTLPVAGTYTITVDPRDQLVGTVTFTLGAVPDNTGTTAIGSPTTVTIGTIGENAVRTFTATAGQKVTLRVTGQHDPRRGLLGGASERRTVASLFVSAATAFRDTFTLPVDGHVHAHVNPRDQLVGTLTFTLNPVPDNTGTTAIGTPTTVTIGTIGEVAVRTFAATAGQSVTISVTGNTIPGADISCASRTAESSRRCSLPARRRSAPRSRCP